MKRIIIPMASLLGLVLLISAQCASNVNVDGTYERTDELPAGNFKTLIGKEKFQGTLKITMKRDNNKKVSGTIEMNANGFLGFIKVADIKGDLKDEGGGITLNTSVTPVQDKELGKQVPDKINQKLKQAFSAAATADTTLVGKVLAQFKTLYTFKDNKAAKFKVLDNGASLEDPAGKKYKKK